jgi:hypothetical protein
VLILPVFPKTPYCSLSTLKRRTTCIGAVAVYIHRREGPGFEWKLRSDQPHPDWGQMSLEHYKVRGRSECCARSARRNFNPDKRFDAGK